MRKNVITFSGDTFRRQHHGEKISLISIEFFKIFTMVFEECRNDSLHFSIIKKKDKNENAFL